MTKWTEKLQFVNEELLSSDNITESFSDYEKSLTSVLKRSGVTRVTREWRSRKKQGAWEPSVTGVAIFFSLVLARGTKKKDGCS